MRILQCIAAAATDSAMPSSRAPSRGWNQWRRGFSDRPSGGGGGRDAFVSGDSHFRSVSDANSALRHGDGRSFRNSGRFYRPAFRSPPAFRQPRPFRQPQTKPPDFRNWEYALKQPPSHCERFIVLSYNILADHLAFKHRRELYCHIPRHILDWEWRKRKIVFELGLWSPDIMCFQEVDRFQDLEDELKNHGYSGIWKMRTGIPIDGCATFWRIERFKLLHEESIEFNKLGLRDNVAQICVFESRNQNHAVDGSETFPMSSNVGNRVVVCNIHVLYNPKRGEIKLGQVRVLLDRAHAVSRLWNDAPVIICGDFNCTPKSPLYNFISEQKLNLTGLARDEVSGQSSGQLYTSEPYDHSPGNHMHQNRSPDNPDGAPLLDDGKDSGIKHNNSGNIGDTSLANNFSQLRNDNGMQDMSYDSSSGSHYKNGKQNPGATNEEEVVSSGHHIPVEPGNKSPNSCPKEAVITVGSVSEVSSDFTACSVHRTWTEHSSSSIDQSSPVLATVLEESFHYSLEKESLSEEGISSFGETQAIFDQEATNASVPDISSAFVPEALLHDEIETSPPKHCENILSESVASERSAVPLTSAKSVNQEKESSNASICVDLSFIKLDDPTKGDRSLTYDHGSKLSSDICSTDVDLDANLRSASLEGNSDTDECGTVSYDLQSPSPSPEVHCDSSPSVDSEIAFVEKSSYDPYLWTPMEIETASGNAECTIMEHPLKLMSTYAEVEDYSGTRDSTREPQMTSYNRKFMGTVDYIWCSLGVQTVKVLDTIPKHALQWTSGLPTPKWGSDHLALASQLAFTKNVDQS